MPAEPPQSPAGPTSAELTAALTRWFGHPAFRPGQEAIVRSVLGGRPTLAILPTGGGKSLCYQLPALLLPGTTLVVSPLVALMKDQVDQLQARGVAATFVNSSLDEAEQRARQAAIRRGELKLVYVAPERFRSPSFLAAIAQLQIPLLAVDEAHCISAWGHDFRPDYARLAAARAELKAERVLALTATATPEVRRDIAKGLGLAEPKVFVAGFDRPNLFVEIVRAEGDRDKLQRLVALLRAGGPGLVYAATRRNVEKVVLALRGHGVDAVGYHAGMGDEARTDVQERFLRGQARVVVATNAFGMGVDKADIRVVAHFDVPRSVEAYYQEIGRAGRDGQESLAVLLFNFADVMMQRRMIDQGRASERAVRAVLAAAQRLESGSLDDLVRRTGLDPQEVAASVRLLESAGHLLRGRSRGPAAGFEVGRRRGPFGEDEAGLDIDFAQLEERGARERQMLDRMVRFVDTRGCRRQNLLRYFGDPEAPVRCPACDNCVGPRTSAGEELLLSGSSFGGRSPRGPRKAERPARTPGAALGPHDEQAFQELRALRSRLARESAVPPYVIFHDSVLQALARELPESRTTFLLVKGAGEAKWERYGEAVLAITKAAAARRERGGAAPDGKAGTPPLPRPPLVRKPDARAGYPAPPELPLRLSEEPPWAEGPSWAAAPPPGLEPEPEAPPAPAGRLEELLGQGLGLNELAQRLGQPAAEVASAVADLRGRGRPVDLGRLLGAERLAAIRAAAPGCDGDLVAIRRKLPFAASLGEVRLALWGA